VFLIYSKVFSGRSVVSSRTGGQAGASCSSVIQLASQRAARSARGLVNVS
jgi:hypothetical protein